RLCLKCGSGSHRRRAACVSQALATRSPHPSSSTRKRLARENTKLAGESTLGKAKIMKTSRTTEVARSATPLTGQRARTMQAFGSVESMPIALAEDARRRSADNLNQLLADTITLRDLYKKHHWQVSGPTFYQLHLLFDKHFGELNELVDMIAERIMMLGGISVAMAADVAETTLIPRPPKEREEVPVQISRLLQAHEIVLKEARA